MFTAKLSVIERMWKQPKCLKIDGCSIYTNDILTMQLRKRYLAFHCDMGKIEVHMLSEIGQKEKKQILDDLTCLGHTEKQTKKL